MQLVDIILDNRISCSFLDDVGAENVIFCRPIEESLDNVSLIATKSSEFIHSYLEESAGKYLVTSVVLDDGTAYENVRFRLVTVEEGRELPASTINLSSLGSPSATDVLLPSHLIEEEVDIIAENTEEDDDFGVLYNVPEVIDNSEIVQKVKALESKLVTEQQKLEQEKIKLNKERTILENERRLSKALEDYKAELLQETFLVSNHQKELLEKSIQDLNNSFQEQFDSQQINVEKYLDTLSLANLEEVKKYQDEHVDRIKDQISTLLSERQIENSLATDKLLLERTAELESIFTEKLITELEDHKRNVKIEIDGINNALDNLISEKLKENNDNVDQLLVSRAGVLQEQFNEKLTKDLTDHKDNLFNDFKTVSNDTASRLFAEKTEELNNALTIVLDEHKRNLDTTVTGKINEISTVVSTFKTEVDGKLPQLDETIKEINKRIQTLVVEKKNVQSIADDARKYTDTKVAQVSEDVMNYARRILDLGGGGGSNAVQYANGGTMNGNLNVTGQYLSGGVDIATLFGRGGGGSGNSPYVYALPISSYNIIPLSGNNTVTESAYGSNILGGSSNTISGYNSTILGGGANNICAGFGYNTIAGGQNNTSCSGYNTFIGSGYFNTTCANFTYIGGGISNTASGNYSSILGGCRNSSSGYANVFILGSNITAIQADTTYVNNLSSQGSIASNTASFANGATTIDNGGNITLPGSGPGQGTGPVLSWGPLQNSTLWSNGDAFIGYDANVAANGIGFIAGDGSATFAFNKTTIDSTGTVNAPAACFVDQNGTIQIGGNYANSSAVVRLNNDGNSIFSVNKILLSTEGNVYLGPAAGDGGATNTILYNDGSASLANGSMTVDISGNAVVHNLSATDTVYTSNVIGNGSEVVLSDGNSDFGNGANTLSLNFTNGVFASDKIYAPTLSANTVCSTTYYGDGSHLTGISTVTVYTCGNSPFASAIQPTNGSNTASGYYSNIGGGTLNSINSNCSIIAGGYANCVCAPYSGIIGGYNNCICSGHSNTFVLGSNICTLQPDTTYVNNLSTSGNINTGSICTSLVNTPEVIGTGTEVVISDGASDAGNGASTLSLNFVNGVYINSSLAVGLSSCATSAGTLAIGLSSRATGAYSTVAGGQYNTASGYESFIGSGSYNTASDYQAIVVGGVCNIAGNGAVIVGGYCNRGYGDCSFIGGGRCNTTNSGYSVIGGGFKNTASGPHSTVSSGICNTASNTYTSVGGGGFNIADGYASNIAGGQSNCAGDGYSFIGGGYCNFALKHHSSIVGGQCNTVSGCYSFIAGGTCNYSNLDNTFILGSSLSATQTNYTYVNNLSSQGVIAAACVIINQTPTTFTNPVRASGTFLIVNINGVNKALQLWDYTS